MTGAQNPPQLKKEAAGGTPGEDVPIRPGGHSTDEEGQYHIVKLDETLIEGQIYYFSMTFDYILNDQMRGFYRSVYKDENDQDV